MQNDLVSNPSGTTIALTNLSDIIIDMAKGFRNLHGRIRAAPLVAFCGEYWRRNQVERTQGDQGTAEKCSAALPDSSPRLHNCSSPSASSRKEQTRLDGGRQVWQAVLCFRYDGSRVEQARRHPKQNET